MTKKNRMRRHTIFQSYCRYYGCYYYCMTTVVATMSGSYCRSYSCHAIVVTTIVTTVATENHMPTHAIFFLIYECPMLGTVYNKKLYPSKQR